MPPSALTPVEVLEAALQSADETIRLRAAIALLQHADAPGYPERKGATFLIHAFEDEEGEFTFRDEVQTETPASVNEHRGEPQVPGPQAGPR